MKYVSLFIGLAILFSSMPALALGKLGHQLVCQLAYDQLSPSTKVKVDSLLSTAPQSKQEKINQYNFAGKHETLSYAKACNWPDAVKREAKYKRYKSWHYVNVDRASKTVNHQKCTKGCVTKAIGFHQKQLANSKSEQVKRHALMFLGHWLGDIHQPMHVSFASDLGGNKTKVNMAGVKCNNLHWLWDECLLSSQVKSKKLQQQFAALYQKLSKTLAEHDTKSWRESNVIDWANESLVISRDASTKYCVLNSMSVCKPIKQRTIQLPSHYLIVHSQVLNKRILQASVRLADLIETSL